MAQPNYSDFSTKEYPIDAASNLRIAIVKSEWNADIIERMSDSCVSELAKHGITSDHISYHKVPGSYELPLGAKFVLGSALKADAVICLGCVIQGETKHDDYINHSIAQSISHLSLMSGTPVIFGVLTTNTLAQAEARSGGDHGCKGSESAIAALKMISLKQGLATSGSKISF